MKKFRILLGALALAVVAATLSGCKKEKSLDGELSNVYYNSVQSKIPYSEIKVRGKSCKGENGSSSILVFNSMDALRQTIEDLDNQVKSLENVFMLGTIIFLMKKGPICKKESTSNLLSPFLLLMSF